MAEPHNIALVVGANIDPLRRDMRQATSTVGDFATKSRENLNIAGKAFIPFGATAAASLAALYVQGAKVIDQQAKSARALGGTTEAFQALAHAAELAGVASTVVEADLRKLNRELANPSERTAGMLRELGLSAQQLMGLDIDARVATIADRFRELGYTTAQTDAALKDMAVEAQGLGKMFLDGGQQIRDAREELQAWGVAITDIDAAKVEAANDAFSRVRTVLGGVGQALAREVSPFVEALTRQFTEAAKEGGGVGAIVARGFQTAIRAGGFLADMVRGLHVGFKGLEVAGNAFSYAITAAMRAAWNSTAAFTDSVIVDVNKIINAFNKIPGVQIANVDYFSDSAFIQGLNLAADVAQDRLATVRQEFQALATEPMPSENFKQWADEVVAEADRVAASVVAARRRRGGGSR